MRHMTKVTLILLFLCSGARSESLESLSEFLLTNGSIKLIDHLGLENKNLNSLYLENELLIMGSDETVTPTLKWKLESLSGGTGIKLSLGTGYHYFANFPVPSLGLETCPVSGASSGVAYKTHRNGTTTRFSWSCGSSGCSFGVKLGEGFSTCF